MKATEVEAARDTAAKETAELKIAEEEATAEETAVHETTAKETAQVGTAEEEAAAKETAKKVDEESYARGETNKKVASEKPAPRTSFLWSAVLFPILLVVPLLHHNMSRGHCPAVSTSSASPFPWICSSPHSTMYRYMGIAHVPVQGATLHSIQPER